MVSWIFNVLKLYVCTLLIGSLDCVNTVLAYGILLTWEFSASYNFGKIRMDSSSTHPYWKTLNWVYAPLMEKWCVDLLSIRDSCGYWVRDLMFDLRICLWLSFDIRICIYINDYSNMIWNVEWQILYFDLWFLCRSIINQVYYEYMFMCICGSFYGRLQIDIWTVDHRCDRITYNPLWLWTGYPDFVLIGLWPPTLWTGFPDLSRVDHPQRGHLSPCDFILLLCAIWFYVIHSLSLLYLSLFHYDHTCLYSSRYRIKFRIMIMFLLFTL